MSEPRAKVGRVVLALIAGLVAGRLLEGAGPALASRAGLILSTVGTLWISAVRMTVIPLVVSLLFVSIADAGFGGGPSEMRREAAAAAAAFVALLLLAALTVWLIGAPLVNELPIPSAT